MSQKLVVILGPTAVGKTKFAVQLANHFNGEIVSADSRQVYKNMTIGTGKDLDEYDLGKSKVPYHLIDVLEPSEEYNLYQFNNDFNNCLNSISAKNKMPFLVGGTGLYIHSVLKDYNLNEVDFNSDRAEYLSKLSNLELEKILSSINPNLHNTTDLVERSRIIKAILIAETDSKHLENKNEFYSLVLGIREEREIIKNRITLRLKYRLENGMIEEVENLIARGISFEKLEFFGLEYRYISHYLQGKLSYNDMYQKLNSSIHKFAKRQMTWFRKMEREGIEINWLTFSEIEKAKIKIANFINE
jgi:tRNA dimethylallyltransferase